MDRTTESSRSQELSAKGLLYRLIIRKVYRKFITQAERKLRQLETVGLDRNEDYSVHLQIGKDAEFDLALESLAMISKQCPKLIIDSIMMWRSTIKEQPVGNLQEIENEYPQLTYAELEARAKKRNSLIANFILCRALMQVIQNLGVNTLNPDLGYSYKMQWTDAHLLGKKLEDMIFAQIRASDAAQTAKYANLEANVRIFSQLLGALSEVRFTTITERFVTELREISKLEKQYENRIENLLNCMHYLHLKIYPMTKLEETTDFLKDMAKLFQNANSAKLKFAYCDMFLHLLVPIARIADAEVNVPSWQKTIELILPKVLRMVQKNRNPQAALPLMTTLLCVSRKDYFLKNWGPFVDILIAKLKERSLSPLAVKSICYLVWTYLFRSTESPSSVVQKKLDYFLKVLFPEKKTVLPMDYDYDVFARILYYILVRYPEFGNEKLVNLLNSDAIFKQNERDASSYRSDVSINTEEFPNAERLLIIIRAFLLFMRDIEIALLEGNGNSNYFTTLGTVSEVHSISGLVVVEGKVTLPNPGYPAMEKASDYTFEYLARIGTQFDKRDNEDKMRYAMNYPLKADLVVRLGENIRESLAVVNDSAGMALLCLQYTIGNNYFYKAEDAKQNQSTSSAIRRASLPVVDTLNSFTGVATRPDILYLEENKASETKEKVYANLLCVIFDSIPRLTPSGVSRDQLIQMLCGYMLNADKRLNEAAFQALSRIAKVRTIDPKSEYWKAGDDCCFLSALIYRTCVQVFDKFLKEKYDDVWPCGEFSERYLIDYSKKSASFLKCWLDDIKSSREYKPTPSEAVDIPNFIESIGYILFLDPVPEIRFYGLELFQIAADMEKALHAKMRDKQERRHFSKTDSVSRLSTFHKGKRAALYAKYNTGERISENGSYLYIRVYDILLDQGANIIKEHYFSPLARDSALQTTYTPEFLQNYQKELLAKNDPVIYVAISKDPLNNEIWEKSYPELLKFIIRFAHPASLQFGFTFVWGYLARLYPIINFFAFGMNQQVQSPFSSKPQEFVKLLSNESAASTLIQHWRSVMLFIYATCNPAQSVKLDDSNAPLSVQSLEELNKYSLKFLTCERDDIREGVIIAAGKIPTRGYDQVLKDIHPYIQVIVKNSRQRLSFDRKSATVDLEFTVRDSITQLLVHIGSFGKVTSLRGNTRVMTDIVDYLRAMVIYFTDSETDLNFECQKLKYNFSVLVHTFYESLLEGCQSNDRETVEQYIPIRLRRDLFGLFESWSGFGIESATFKFMEEQKLKFYIENLGANVNKSEALEAYQSEKNSVQVASIRAICSMCKGPVEHPSDAQITFEVPRLFGWINDLLKSENTRFHNYAQLAIENILSFNPKSKTLIKNVVDFCFLSPETVQMQAMYFTGFVDLVTKENLWQDWATEIICLAQFHSASDFAQLRKAAVKLFCAIDNSVTKNEESYCNLLSMNPSSEFNKSEVIFCDIFVNKSYDNEGLVMFSNLPHGYKRAFRRCSERLAKQKQEMAYEVLGEITKRIGMLVDRNEMERCKDLLAIAIAWTKYVRISECFDLKNMTIKNGAISNRSWGVLNNLLFMSVILCDSEKSYIADLWKSLILGFSNDQAVISENSKIVMHSLIQFSILMSSSRVLYTSKVVFMILHGINPQLVFADLVNVLNPTIDSTNLDQNLAVLTDILSKDGLHYTIDLAKYCIAEPDLDSQYFVPVQIYADFLAEIITAVRKSDIIQHLPVILTLVFALMDTSASKAEEMKLLLVYLLNILDHSDQALRRRTLAAIFALTVNAGKKSWKYEDTVFTVEELDSTQQMEGLALEIADLFFAVYPTIIQDWSYEMLLWGTYCSNYHIACRCLQLFRCLPKKPEVSHLTLISKCMANSISQGNVQIQQVNYELQKSLFLTCKSEVDADIIYSTLMPMFWLATANLSSIHEQEYDLGLQQVCAILRKPGYTIVERTRIILHSIPKNFQFNGLLPLFLRGMTSNTTEKLSLDLINFFLFSDEQLLLTSNDNTLILAAIANLPRLMKLEAGDKTDRLKNKKWLAGGDIAAKLSNVKVFKENFSLSRLFNDYVNGRFSTPEDFLKQLFMIIRESFPQVEWEIILFCIRMLANPIEWYPNCCLTVLEYLLKDLPPFTKEILTKLAGHNNSWLSPLMELLDGPFGSRASFVLAEMLGGSIKIEERDISYFVGGAQNLYAYVKRVQKLDSKTSTTSGWLIESDANEISQACQDRIEAVYLSLPKTTPRRAKSEIALRQQLEPKPIAGKGKHRGVQDLDKLVQKLERLKLYYAQQSTS